jgi:hypothetical protein
MPLVLHSSAVGPGGGEAKPAQWGAVCCCARLIVACADADVCVGSCSPAAAALLGAGYLRWGTHANIYDPCPLSATLARWPRCLGPCLKHLHPLVHAPAQYRVSQSLVCSTPAHCPYACTCTTYCGRHNLRGAFSTAQCLLAPYPADTACTAGLVNTRAAIDLGTRAAAPPLQEIGVTCSHQALYWQQGDQACAMAIFCKLHSPRVPCTCTSASEARWLYTAVDAVSHN